MGIDKTETEFTPSLLTRVRGKAEALVQDPVGETIRTTVRGVEAIVRKGLTHPVTFVPALALGATGLATLAALATLLPKDSVDEQ